MNYIFSTQSIKRLFPYLSLIRLKGIGRDVYLGQGLITAITSCVFFFFVVFTSAVQAAGTASKDDIVILHADQEHPGKRIPSDFLGFSFEANDSLMHGQFGAGLAGTSMAALMNRLGRGVLRLGGNSSDSLKWTPPQKKIDELGKFMQLIPNWALIFGLNLADYDANKAAAIAASVAAAVPSAIFQFGNEPDFYPFQKHRPQNYNVTNYIDEWNSYYRAVSLNVPRARVAGPDIALTESWLAPFIASTKGRIVFASRHYYPFCVKSVATVKKLLDSGTKYLASTDLNALINNPASVPVRITETNSVCGGGAENVSDTIVSAVWATEMLIQLANAGAAGVNFHGGRVSKMHYSPFVQKADGSFEPQPVYYSMLLFSSVTNAKLLPIQSSVSFNSVPVIAVLDDDGNMRYVVANKSLNRSLRVKVWNDSNENKTKASSLILAGISLTDKKITLGKDAVDSLGKWEPEVEIIPRGKDIVIPPMSATLITLY